MMKKILFVCTGNSCRSVMAEGLLKHLLSKKGRDDIQVMSAGVGTLGGLGPTLETVEVMGREGIDVSSHVGKPLAPELVQSADLIFCMEDFHRQIILSQVPAAESKVHLLKIFQAKVVPAEPNIMDPIGKPKEVYESCLMTIKESVEHLARWLEKQG